MADQIQDDHPRNYRKWYACIYAYEIVEKLYFENIFQILFFQKRLFETV